LVGVAGRLREKKNQICHPLKGVEKDGRQLVFAKLEAPDQRRKKKGVNLGYGRRSEVRELRENYRTSPLIYTQSREKTSL